MITSKDYGLAAIAGLLSGIFLIPTIINIGYDHVAILAGLPVVLAFCWIVGLKVAKEIAKMVPVILQIAKFAEIGVLNTAINFGVLNMASLITGVTAGLLVGGYNVPGTFLAASNSYFWNKLWVFKKAEDQGHLFKDVPKFALVTIIGLIANSVIIVAFTSYLSPMFGINPGAWLNIGKLIATIVGVLIDFLGYKYIVFKTPAEQPVAVPMK